MKSSTKEHTGSSSIHRKVILKITPQTPIRTTQNDKWFFRIDRTKLRPEGLRRLKRIERYNDYKISVAALAKSQNFTFPPIGASIKFYLPVPASWPKYKKQNMHLQYHTNRNDLDNLIKGLLDSLLSEDKHIAHLEAAKYWVNLPEGYIEITETRRDLRIE